MQSRRPQRANSEQLSELAYCCDVSGQAIDERVDIGLDINSSIAVACISHYPGDDDLSKLDNIIFDPKLHDDDVN